MPLGERRPDDLAALGDPNSIEAEAYRTLRTAVEFLLNESGAKVVLVTSPRPGEGKSSVAANLAVTAAQAGRNVVLIDGDLRKPQMHRSFGLRNDRGLSSVLTGDSTLSQAVKRTEAEPNLAVLPAGPPPPDPADLLLSDRLAKAIDGLAQAADLVVIDAPPVLPVTDSTILVQHCDAVLLAATSGLSDRREWQETLDRLAVVRANVIGTVLSRPDSRVDSTTAYHYAPTAAPANWWVAQASGAERANVAAPADVTTVMTRDPVDDLIWDRKPASSAKPAASAGPSTAPSPVVASAGGAAHEAIGTPDDDDSDDGRDGAGNGDGDERGPDGGLQGTGSSDGEWRRHHRRARSPIARDAGRRGAAATAARAQLTPRARAARTRRALRRSPTTVQWRRRGPTTARSPRRRSGRRRRRVDGRRVRSTARPATIAPMVGIWSVSGTQR